MCVCKQIRLGFGILVATLALAAPTQLGAEEPNATVYPLTEKVVGKTYMKWAAAWWQWGLSIPKDKNPITDKTGKFAGEGQSGQVWFLAGNFGGEVTRKCSMPTGKTIFFPVVNQGPGGSFDNPNEEALRDLAKGIMDTVHDLEVIVDGQPLKDVMRYRVQTPLFTLSRPEREAEAVISNIAGKHKMVSDGYWIMLKPLTPGEHVIRFKGKVKKTGFSLDVTYQLTVVKEKKS